VYPSSRYFRIGADQVDDYARRRGLDRSTVERSLRPNLADR
jgi:5-methyltetrahydrofolate--homocysteine methyltransferase